MLCVCLQPSIDQVFPGLSGLRAAGTEPHAVQELCQTGVRTLAQKEVRCDYCCDSSNYDCIVYLLPFTEHCDIPVGNNGNPLQ